MSVLRPAALDALESAAREAALSEREFRESFAQEIARLESERRRAYRRFNFLTALVAADSGTDDREASRAAQRAAAADELGWTDVETVDAQALEAMQGLADAVHDERLLGEAEVEQIVADAGVAEPMPVAVRTHTPAEARGVAILMALAAFEDAYETLRGKPFAAMFDRTFPDTPLVDF